MKKITTFEKAVVIIAIIICVSILGTVFYFNENDIVYGISIMNHDIPVGDNITLHYEIKNGMFAHSVSNVDLDIWVYDVRDTNFQEGLLHYYIPVNVTLYSGGVEGQVAISAHYLDPGIYLVSATLWYKTDISYYKYLETEFEIYSEEG